MLRLIRNEGRLEREWRQNGDKQEKDEVIEQVQSAAGTMMGETTKKRLLRKPVF